MECASPVTPKATGMSPRRPWFYPLRLGLVISLFGPIGAPSSVNAASLFRGALTV
jgi:hypothetical protein